MRETLTAEDITPRINELVAQYLVAKAKAEMLREQVDEVRAEVIQRVPLYRHDTGERITDIEFDWLDEDQERFWRYLETVSDALKEDGVKPWDMRLEICPALVAEHELRKIEWALIDEMSDIFDMGYESGEMNDRLLALGVGNRQEFIDAVVGAALAIEAKSFTNNARRWR